MRYKDFNEEIELPEKVTATVKNNEVTVKGPNGEIKRTFKNPKVKILLKGKNIIVRSINPTKREKTAVFCFKSHIKNIVKGVVEKYVYEMKVCSSHFPMTVTFNNGEFAVKNFLGEKYPRKLKINKNVNVKVAGEIITIEAIDIEEGGMAASNIEQLTRIADKDLRVFQDGIYITKKPK